MRVQLPNGQNLHYLDAGEGPVLVLLHGWAMSSVVFADSVRALSNNFRLLVPDLPGHGQSDPGPDFSLAAIAADIRIWLDTLKIDSYHLLGWSFGGQLAMQLATDNIDKVERMVLVASTPKFCQSDNWSHGLPDVQVRAMQRRLQRDQEATLDDFVNLMFTGEVDGTTLAATVREQSIAPEHIAGREILATLRLGDLRDQLAQISIPTLIHHGQDDSIIPVAAGQFLAEQIPDCELSIFNDVGHAPFLSRPKQSQALWKEFLL